MKSHSRLFGLALFLAALQTVAAQGTLILGHFGSADPTNEGFSLLRNGSPSLTPVMDDLGYNAWSIGVSAGTDIGQYKESLTPEQATALSDDWTLSLTLRVGQSVNPGDSGIFASISTGTEYFMLDFGAQANGDPAIELANYSQYVLNGAGSGYHNYELRYDAATDSASLWADSTQWLTDIQGNANLGVASLVWGIGQHASVSSYYANWNEMSLWAAPEPSTYCFVFLGSGILFYVRKRRQFRFFRRNGCNIIP